MLLRSPRCYCLCWLPYIVPVRPTTFTRYADVTHFTPYTRTYVAPRRRYLRLCGSGGRVRDCDVLPIYTPHLPAFLPRRTGTDPVALAFVGSPLPG